MSGNHPISSGGLPRRGSDSGASGGPMDPTKGIYCFKISFINIKIIYSKEMLT